jgi:hypothetical protein
MLACGACNLSKHDKPIINPFDPRQRLLNCTEENEFDGHIIEEKDGRWIPKTIAGNYHLIAIGLQEEFHRKKRAARREVAEQILKLCITAIQYKTQNPAETHAQLMETAKVLLDKLDYFPPLVGSTGPITVKDWLKQQGIHLFS